MAKVLIVYNNDPWVSLHNFFESCGDEVKQYCYDRHVDFTSIVPPEMSESNVMQAMEHHDVCFIAAHGDFDSICNEQGEDVVSTRTTNYNLQDKMLYSVSCRCGVDLGPSLVRIGISLFVGYKDTFRVNENYVPFIQSALAGLKSLINGENAETAKENMYHEYEKQIDIADANDEIFTATLLLHNKESLVFEGDADYLLL